MSQNVQTIIDIVLTIAVILLNVFVVPAFKKWVSKYISDSEYNKINQMIKMLVQAAEQKFPGQGAGSSKYKYVMTELTSAILSDPKSINGDSYAEIEQKYGAAVESAVFEISNKPTD